MEIFRAGLGLAFWGSSGNFQPWIRRLRYGDWVLWRFVGVENWGAVSAWPRSIDTGM